MTDAAVEAAHQKLLKMSVSHRVFALPILRAIHALGGSAKKKAVMEQLRKTIGAQMPAGLFEEIDTRGRFGWTRFGLKQMELLGGEDGVWALTELGRRYVDAHAGDVVVIPPITLAEAAEKSTAQNGATHTVPVTSFRAYEIPVLEALAAGRSKPKEIDDFLAERLKNDLLPGDLGAMPSGTPVWRFRSAWSRSNLGKAGHASNVQSGSWAITESGRQRLEAEKGTWSFASFPVGNANILVDEADAATAPAATSAPALTPADRWAKLREHVSDDVVTALQMRLRPDLGATPDSGSIARNIILYGPPGTGKTHVAKLVARTLSGDDDGGSDGRFRLVQFHPSYAYEDFIQGLRPDLTKTELRYSLGRGPFLRIVEDAESDPEHFYVLVIDEVNRGDPARIFGELLYALEYRDEPVTLALGGELAVPSNLVIIGTMNSVDRSVALVDYALRRRFGFIRLDPDESVVESAWGDTLLGNAGGMVLLRFNAWLTQRLDREHVLGHSFFLSKSLDPSSTSTFDALWSLDVQPLLEEYFFGDVDGLKEAAARWRSIVAEALAEGAAEAAEHDA